MHNSSKALALSATVIAMTALTASAQDQPYTVQWVGAQRDVMRGDLISHISLDSLAERCHLYALGPLEQLQGEITIWDGEPSIARIRSGQITFDRTFHHRAAFLVWAEVDRARVAPDFTLTAADGVRLSGYRADVVALTFGYTFCPDVCPTTLADLAQVKARLGEDGRRLHGLFVTVDPRA